MPFNRILSELVRAVPGGRSAILADWEGEAVEQHAHGDVFELKVLGAHKGIILQHLRDLHGGQSKDLELVVRSRERTVIVGAVGSDYAVSFTLSPDAVVGRAMVHFREAVRLLEREIY